MNIAKSDCKILHQRTLFQSEALIKGMAVGVEAQAARTAVSYFCVHTVLILSLYSVQAMSLIREPFLDNQIHIVGGRGFLHTEEKLSITALNSTVL